MSKTAFIVEEDATNAEVFEAVFGYKPSPNARCVAPNSICKDFDNCKKCPFSDWWNKQYKPCFELKGDTDEPNKN